MFKRSFLVIASIALIASCSDDKENNLGKPGAGGSLEDIEAATNGWKTACLQDDSGSYTNQTTVVGSTLTVLTEEYSGMNCNTLERKYRMVASAITEGTNASNSAVTNLNLIIQKTEEWLETDAIVNSYNSNKVCGINTWEKRQWVNQASTTCNSVGVAIYHIFRITGDSLYLGLETEANDGTSPDKRPTALDVLNAQIKQ